jgi:hypothetical protein
VTRAVRFARALVRARWNIVRLVAALALLWYFAADSGARLARLALASLPDVDYAAEAEKLRQMGHYGEAVVVLDAALSESDPPHHLDTSGPSDGAARAKRDELLAQRARIQDEQSSYLRRATEVGKGAVMGPGDSLESLVGAVAADFFVVGDIRDLVIQSARYAREGEADEVIVALSALGILTTLQPELDWVPSIFKAARRAGSLGKGLGEQIVKFVKAGERSRLLELMTDVSGIARRSSPATAGRILRHAGSAEDLGLFAKFAERTAARGRPGALALAITGDAGAEVLRAAAKPGARLSVTAADDLVIAAAKKGPAGAAFLSSKLGARLLRPHALVGLAKGFTKGTIPDAAAKALARLDPYGWLALPALAAWTLLELTWLARRLCAPARARALSASSG